MSKQIHNFKILETKRKSVRNHSTSSEVLLWIELKDKKLDGRKFRRQHSIGKYIVDFYCPSERLIIEIEGNVHENTGQNSYDGRRRTFLENLRFKVLFFENKEVKYFMESVLVEIARHYKVQI